MSQSAQKSFMGHPKGLATLFFTEMWERFSYYGMKAILMLFMVTDTAQEGLGIENETAGAAYGLYAAGVYLLTLPGGWLADNVFGQRKAVWYGGILIMIGHIILAISSIPAVFFLGLCFIAMGTGLLKPNISTMVGDLYPEGGARRDAGFSIFYMGINIGSVLGQIIVPILAENVNWHLGFGIAAVGMFLGLVQYRMTQGSLDEIGVVPKAKVTDGSVEKANSTIGIILAVALVGLIALLQMFGVVDLTTAIGIRDTLGVVIVLVTLFFFLYIFLGGGLNADEKKKMVVVALLFVGAAIFWSGFEQAPTTLTLFARDLTDRDIFGFNLAAGSVQFINPLFIIILTPLFGALWIKLAAKNLNPSTPLKFGFGLILMALGFLVMVKAAEIATPENKVGLYWFILTYFLHSAGELTLSPVGLSTMTKLAPARFYGQIMGLWFVATALGNLIAGWYGGEFDANNLEQMPSLFMSIVWLGLGAGIVFVALSPIAKKWMGDVK
ncbi:MAG: oligopeptide:H+ symporter [Bacteroidota bacterium]